PMLYGARYTVAVAGPPRDAGPVEIDVVGRHCESGDVLAREVKLSQDVRQGDLVAVAGTGAYTYSMAGTYNRVGRPAVVAVRDGVSRVWLRREDAADLDRLEASAPSFRTAPPRGEGFEGPPAPPGGGAVFPRGVPKRGVGTEVHPGRGDRAAPPPVSETVPPSRHGARR